MDCLEVTFHGNILRRGFWLYVWEVTPPRGKQVYYVGRTGDSSSMNAQSPFNRMGQHLGFLKNANMLRTHVRSRDFDPERCRYRIVAHGPILEEANTMELHRERRDVMEALERELERSMRASGYDVMNTVNSHKPVNKRLFAGVRTAFGKHFSKLSAANSEVEKNAIMRRNVSGETRKG